MRPNSDQVFIVIYANQKKKNKYKVIQSRIHIDNTI